MKLTEKQQELLFYEEETVKGFTKIAEQQLYTDSHGDEIWLCVLELKDSDQLYGFLYMQTSEEIIYDYPELYELRKEQILVNIYKRKDGLDFD